MEDDTHLFTIVNGILKILLQFCRIFQPGCTSVAGADDVIMGIWVPGAKREQKPGYINDDLFGGTFRRNWEGDYHCTRLQVKTMLRDQAEETICARWGQRRTAALNI